MITETAKCLHFGKALWKQSERYQKIMLQIKVPICRTEILVCNMHISALWGKGVIILLQDFYVPSFANKLHSDTSAEHGRQHTFPHLMQYY